MTDTREDILSLAIREAIELLAERKYGHRARSPGHNARLCLESALYASPPAPAVAVPEGIEQQTATWPPLKLALWGVVTGEELNTPGRYVNAYHLTHKLFEAAMLAAAPTPPAAEAPGQEPVAAFGHGKLVVDFGTVGGVPAVFVAPAKQPGEVGASAKRENQPLDRMIEGEFFMTFPTEEQAKLVADALMNRSAPPTYADAEAMGFARGIEAAADAVKKAGERVGSLETPAMRGDNLAICLCSHFEDGGEEDGDTGWCQAATDGYEEVTKAIRDHYATAIRSLASPAQMEKP